MLLSLATRDSATTASKALSVCTATTASKHVGAGSGVLHAIDRMGSHQTSAEHTVRALIQKLLRPGHGKVCGASQSAAWEARLHSTI